MAIQPLNEKTLAHVNSLEATKVNQANVGELNPYKTGASNVAELREKAPEVYNQMIKSLLTNFINQNNRFQDRLKKALGNSRHG